jgi:plastocyanin
VTERAPRLTLAAAAAVFAVVIVAAPVVAADQRITITDFRFVPRAVTIGVGDRVTWVNQDAVEHDADGAGWSTSLLAQGERDSVRFNHAGTYRYVCSIHPTMTGTVVVRAIGGVAPDTATEHLNVPPDGGPPVTLLAMFTVVTIGAAVVVDRLLRRRSTIRT